MLRVQERRGNPVHCRRHRQQPSARPFVARIVRIHAPVRCNGIARATVGESKNSGVRGGEECKRPHIPATARRSPTDAIVVGDHRRQRHVDGGGEDHRRFPVLLPQLLGRPDDAHGGAGLHRKKGGAVSHHRRHRRVPFTSTAGCDRLARRVDVEPFEREERRVERHQRSGPPGLVEADLRQQFHLRRATLDRRLGGEQRCRRLECLRGDAEWS